MYFGLILHRCCAFFLYVCYNLFFSFSFSNKIFIKVEVLFPIWLKGILCVRYLKYRYFYFPFCRVFLTYFILNVISILFISLNNYIDLKKHRFFVCYKNKVQNIYVFVCLFVVQKNSTLFEAHTFLVLCQEILKLRMSLPKFEKWRALQFLF